MAVVCWTWLSWGSKKAWPWTLSSRALSRSSFCLCLTGHIQGLWGQWQRCVCPEAPGGFVCISKSAIFLRKAAAVQSQSRACGLFSKSPSSPESPLTPLNSLSKSRGHSSALLCVLQAHEWLSLLTFASMYGPSEFWKSLPWNLHQWSYSLSHQWRMREGNRPMFSWLPL